MTDTPTPPPGEPAAIVAERMANLRATVRRMRNAAAGYAGSKPDSYAAGYGDALRINANKIEADIKALDLAMGRALAPRAPEAVGWRGIESAPDDEEVLVILRAFNEPDGDPLRLIAYKSKGQWWDSAGGGIYDPTHWQPLPQPPRQPAARESGDA